LDSLELLVDNDSIVTLIVVPRERFSSARESLESIYEHTDIPFKLIYVDGASPRPLRSYLENKAREKDLELIRTDHYLPPNRARNLGLRRVQTKYVVFIDNDVIAAPGWLGPLVECAEETGAWLVSPLLCQGRPAHEFVHSAGGQCRIVESREGSQIKRHIQDAMQSQGRPIGQIRPYLERSETELVEFHCMLARADIFERLGPLDEEILNTREHIDLSLAVQKAGGLVYFEPASVITYLHDEALRWSDVPFYMLRWSDEWLGASLRRFQEKWNVDENEYFTSRYKRFGGRRRQRIVKPLVRFLTFGQENKPLEKMLFKFEKRLNLFLTRRYAKKHFVNA
jgi:GT2 family glycosyltransferase